MGRTALITGVTGQDGSYLAELLLSHGYTVHGLARRVDSANTWRLAAIRDQLSLHSGDLRDQANLTELLRSIQPQEVYNLAAQTFVPESWNDPAGSADITALGVARLLEAVRSVDPTIRVCQAGSSEIFGSASESPQYEFTPMQARSPYGAAKIFARHLVSLARQHHGMFVCTAILFNHESVRRGEGFVTRKIAGAAAKIAAGLEQQLHLGNLDAVRDWGHARDYVRAMHLMLQAERPDDYVVGTGMPRTVRNFADVAFARVGLRADSHIVIDPAFVRPSEPHPPVANANKALVELQWKPEISFEELVAEMVDGEVARLKADRQTRRAA